jgi:hypothetical protein
MSGKFVFIRPWKAVRPNDRYESDIFTGEECPPELFDDALAAGVIAEVSDEAPATQDGGNPTPEGEDVFTKAEIRKANKAVLHGIIEDNDVAIDGWEDMTVPQLRDAIIAAFF